MFFTLCAYTEREHGTCQNIIKKLNLAYRLAFLRYLTWGSLSFLWRQAFFQPSLRSGFHSLHICTKQKKEDSPLSSAIGETRLGIFSYEGS